MSVRIQREDFDIGAEIARVGREGVDVGGIASFVGIVRAGVGGDAIDAMTLEHYPGMTEKELARIEAEARSRWPISASLIVHRYGRLEPGDNIVLVVTASRHRQAAFEACEFLVDWLKTKAPFWKNEEVAGDAPNETRWVEARDADDAAAARWDGKKHSS
jgi:molybdopterin synthase catalytic subunit